MTCYKSIQDTWMLSIHINCLPTGLTSVESDELDDIDSFNFGVWIMRSNSTTCIHVIVHVAAKVYTHTLHICSGLQHLLPCPVCFCISAQLQLQQVSCMLMSVLPQAKNLPHALLCVVASRLGAIISHIKLLQKSSHIQQNMCVLNTLAVVSC